MLALSLSLALSAGVVLTPAPALAAATPIECIYAGLDKGQNWDLTVKVVKQGIRSESNIEEEQVNRIGEQVMRCRKRYGWGKAREDAALRYFVGRVLVKDATDHLHDYGFSFAILKEVVDALYESDRATFATGSAQPQIVTKVIGMLKEKGVNVDGVAEGDRTMFGQMVGQAVVGLAMQQKAEADY